MGYVTLGTAVPIPVTTITFSCAAIHFPAVYITYSIIKGHFLSYHAYMVWEVKDPLSRLKCRLGLSPSHLMHDITAMI